MERMRARISWRVGLTVAFAAALATTAGAAPTATWTRLPSAPVAIDGGLTSVWTGKEMIVAGRQTTFRNGAAVKRVNIAAAYDPATGAWRRLPDLGETGSFLDYRSVWTGRELILWGQGTREAFNPATSTWRKLPGSPLLAVHDGFAFVVWTGKEMLGWGGGCCGDAFSDGVAYDPVANRWRRLARSPLNGSQSPVGAWTGRELIVLVGAHGPDGKRLAGARAAAYNPPTNTWRRIAPLPAAGLATKAVWNGRDLLVLGPGTRAFAYRPATKRWRRLAPMPSQRIGGAVVWTGKRLFVWGGTARPGSPSAPRTGFAYDPKTNRWSALPAAPITGRLAPAGVWTGRAFLVWGGSRAAVPLGSGTAYLADGAAFG